jgi:hypothetical protein
MRAIFATIFANMSSAGNVILPVMSDVDFPVREAPS